MEDLRKNARSSVKIVLVGNVSDKLARKEVDYFTGKVGRGYCCVHVKFLLNDYSHACIQYKVIVVLFKLNLKSCMPHS